MKKIILFIWTFSIILLGCKKNDSTQQPIPPQTIDTSYIKATGLIASTEQELQNIQNVEILDTSLVPLIGKLTDLPPTSIIDAPLAGNQGTYNSCVSWSIGYGMLSYHFKIIEGYSGYSVDNFFSPNYIWNQLNGGGNNGISFGRAFNLIKDQGCCKLVDMPVNVAPDILPSQTAKTNAANYKLSDFFRFFTIDINRMKAWLSKGYPVSVGLIVDDALMKTGKSPFEEQPDGRLVWKSYKTNKRYKHAVLICGYDNSINAFKVLNSWGDPWGEHGYFWLDYDFFKTAVSTIVGSLYPEIYIGYIKRPILKTVSITGITQTGAQGGGTISSDWGLSVSSRGVCWSTSPNPTIAGNKTNNGTGIGNFVSNISGLMSNTTYYLKAYAINIVGISYGTEKSFTTMANQITLPIISTTGVTSITQTTAISGGNITNDGGSPVTQRGTCWSISPNPTIANNKTTDGTGTGSFTSSITSLNANTTYNVRAYATNSAGTAYGNAISFTTQQSTGNTVTDFDGNVYNTITIGTQIWMKENLKTTHYRNGVNIPQVTDATQWANLTAGAWCNFGNLPDNDAIYGKLYNWYAVNDARGLAPQGWHIPTDAEWATLTNFLGGESVAGGKMKATTLWALPNTGATNESGFTGLPGGYRWHTGAFFFNNELEGHWWSSSVDIFNYPWNRILDWDRVDVQRLNDQKQYGNSVRCIKD